MKQTLRDLAEKLGCRLAGDGSITVTSVSSMQSATSESLVFVEDAKQVDAALGSRAAAVIAGQFAAAINAAQKPIVISAQPRLTFARAARLLRDPDSDRFIHPEAIVPTSAKIGKNVAVRPARNSRRTRQDRRRNDDRRWFRNRRQRNHRHPLPHRRQRHHLSPHNSRQPRHRSGGRSARQRRLRLRPRFGDRTL